MPGYDRVEGTLVFADVSGFTRLTERLARRGKVGAEEMVTAISDVWEALLATDDGGDVMKFAGDALLIFYQGPDHARRACQRALTMQKELGRVGRIERGGAVVRLRMSIGVNSGMFDFVVAGEDHLDLLILGEAATHTIEMEAAASAGQVLVGEATARLADGARFGARVGGGRLLRSVPSCPPAPPPTSAVEHDSTRFVAPSLRDRLGELDHEHRWAAVAFAQLGAVDSTLAARGSDEVFGLVQRFTTELMQTLDDYGVLLSSCDVVPDGAGFMLTAGVPDANGDDATRMLRVARWIVEGDWGLPVRVGVNAGNVFVGDVGPPFRRAFVTMGDTTNLAARVMSRADWGEALATRFVLEPGDGFITRPLEPFSVKGKRHPVEAAVVEGIAATAAPAAAEGPLVGRDRELETLLDGMAAARSGAGRVVELIGEEGTGKSRLVAEVCRRGQDLRWITVSCDPFERTSAYHTARMLLRQILEIPADAVPEEAGRLLAAAVDETVPHLRPWVPLLAVPFNAAVDPTPEASEVAERYRRVRTQQMVVDLLERYADAPMAIVIEDASDMDDASAELVAEVLGRIEAQPWLAVVTRTPATDGLHYGRGYEADVLVLEPLSEALATELAEKLAETTPVPAHLIPEMVARAGGNPLFLGELIAGVEGETMPHTVEGIVAARIDGLAPRDRQILRYLSVLGEHFDESMVAETLADLDVSLHDEALWARLAAYVQRDGKRISFVNPLVRQVAYEGLRFSSRREIHSRVADAMLKRGGDAVAVHLLRAERWNEAWEAARHAAEAARQAGANAVAAELYDLALEAARHIDPPRAAVMEVAERAGMSWGRVGIPERALESYGVAIGVASDATDRLLLAAQRASVHENAGRFPQALGLYARAITEAEQLEDETTRDRILGVLRAGYASTRHRQGRLEEAIAQAEIAVGHSDRAGDKETLAYLYHLLDRAHTGAGNREQALAYRDLALPIFAELGDLAAQGTVLHDLAADAHRGGRLEEANWLYERAIDARTRAGDVVRAAASVNALGEVELSLGMVDPAERRFAEALRAWRGARSPEGVVVAATNLARVALAREDAAEALARLEEAEHRAADIGAEHLLPSVRLLEGEAHLALGRWVEAWDAATRALEVGGESAQRAAAHEIRARALSATGGETRAEHERAAASQLAE
ncbi:MAG TPA: adenylate/guanylate cyclase domain-containing protein [Acidimicrobiia bacterium]|nr:adenylate/guanylate cyclase domain-containing protein [Acidimicrobiia bacterium]